MYRVWVPKSFEREFWPKRFDVFVLEPILIPFSTGAGQGGRWRQVKAADRVLWSFWVFWINLLENSACPLLRQRNALDYFTKTRLVSCLDKQLGKRILS